VQDNAKIGQERVSAGTRRLLVATLLTLNTAVSIIRSHRPKNRARMALRFKSFSQSAYSVLATRLPHL
jgi:hypothetical protein